MSIKNKIRYIASRVPMLNDRAIAYKCAKLRAHMLRADEIAAGESGEAEKERILDAHRKTDQAYVTRFEQGAREQWVRSKGDQASSEEQIAATAADILWCHLAYGFQADEYVVFDLAHKSPAERKEYISDVERYELYFRVNDLFDKMIYIDKYETYRRFSEYYARQAIRISSGKDFAAFAAFAERHKKIVVKKPDLSKGDSVRLIDAEGFSEEQLHAEFERIIKEGTAIAEELIRQGEQLKRLHPTSVNTLRCVTILTKNGVELFYSFIKMGQSDSFVDNAGQGGVFAGIDVSRGVICTDGFDEYGRRYTVHPDTQCEIKGYPLPAWDCCVDLVKQCARLTPRVRIIGWDVAWSENGWVIVEGNAQGQYICQQTAFEKGLKQELISVLKQ